MTYATTADLATFTGVAATTDDTRLLDRASDLLDAALITAVYDVDSNGLPTDAAVITALKNACCAQVEWWRATGDEMGDAAQWQSVTLGPATMVRRTTVTGEKLAGGGVGVDRLAPRALEYLRTAGLWPGKPILL